MTKSFVIVNESFRHSRKFYQAGDFNEKKPVAAEAMAADGPS
jgi:hypothetical protein